jgi:hypothetical protein
MADKLECMNDAVAQESLTRLQQIPSGLVVVMPKSASANKLKLGTISRRTPPVIVFVVVLLESDLNNEVDSNNSNNNEVTEESELKHPSCIVPVSLLVLANP